MIGKGFREITERMIRTERSKFKIPSFVSDFIERLCLPQQKILKNCNDGNLL